MLRRDIRNLLFFRRVLVSVKETTSKNTCCLHSEAKLSRKKDLSITSKRSYYKKLTTVSTMAQESAAKDKNYEDAIHALNGLQTNASVISKIRKERGRNERNRNQRNSIPDMIEYLSRINIKVDDLRPLNAIHVSATKGKGSICAFSESIMRSTGLKTGLYTSPHLVEVRERIRINGTPLDQEKFTKYFFQVYNLLVNTASAHGDKMPAYFRFLTIMAFHVFLEEKVDVVLLEVGIGGSYDCTNVIREPTVCGVGKLELDHTDLLGDTIDQIAWHKAGIMKPGRPALCLHQVVEAEEVLFDRAKELQTEVNLVPSLHEYGDTLPVLGLSGEHQKQNSSIALQLCRLWLNEKREYLNRVNLTSTERGQLLDNISFENNKINPFSIPTAFQKGLAEASWPGRCHVVERNELTFYLDGAHTPASTQAFVEWFESKHRTKERNAFRILLFNMRGDRGRDVNKILSLLKVLDFDYAVFCPSIVFSTSDTSSDLMNMNVTRSNQLLNCDRMHYAWLDLHKENNNSSLGASSQESASNSFIFPTISTAVRWIACNKDGGIEAPETGGPPVPEKMRKADRIDVLVTGTFHLVGGVLRFLGEEC